MTGEQTPLPPPPGETGPAPEPEEPPRVPWHVKVSAVLFCIFCLELGIFLLLYPWTEAWSRNWWFYLKPEWRPFLVSDQFRGAMSGLGVLNLLLGFRAVFGLRRFAGR
jgi:hypothetical protein